ncbi:MAG TPA: hypothetical protein PLJ47_09255 [Candidatus Hydrogenedentes bacterium]|mgnify:CR=1 FL=1|nr:hypothetical protein [Candidatus Hydrogenedentota bacterium]
MALAFSRYAALIFAIGLAIGEAVINWGNWQWWPLWVIDYVIVFALIAGFSLSRDPRRAHALTTAWTLAFGVFYMAFFVSLESIREGQASFAEFRVVITLMGIMMALAGAGALAAAYAYRQAHKNSA